jgi:catechol 2,3-dioxygenase-like lactoylglutathione lyase family enzyme
MSKRTFRQFSRRLSLHGKRGAIQIGFAVDQPFDDVVREFQARGVVFRGPIIDHGPVRLAFFGDPDGNDLNLVNV